MHNYATDSNERLHVALYLAIGSILLMTLIQWLLNFLNLQIPWWVDGISVFGFYGLFLYLFDRYIWKWNLIQKIGLVKIPNIAGTYVGTLLTSFDDFKNPIQINVDVFQTWTKISVNWKTTTSSSRSVVASINTASVPNILTYQFLNEPQQNAPSGMHMHRGTTIAEIGSDALIGGCYTNRDRKTNGQFELKKTDSK